MDKTITLFNVVTLAIASAALGLSALNLWLSQYRRGKVFLTQPTIFFFGWDKHKDAYLPKILFRSALFSTGSRGQVVENLNVVVTTEDGDFEFPFWGYDDGKGMVRGSGLFVGSTGHVAYHHFNPINDDHHFAYSGTKYTIKIYAKLFSWNKSVLLGSYELLLESSEHVISLANGDGGVMWTWSPQEKKFYHDYTAKPFECPSSVKKLLEKE